MGQLKFSIAEAQKMISDREHVRNLGIIAHIDHGKSTLCDSLLAASGLLAEELAGDARATSLRDDEQERGITIKTTGISLYHEMDGQKFVINLQDTPGHVDFSGEVTSALRVVDGAVIVVDSVEGVCVQTETVTRQALQERVRPVLFINKIDRLITEMKLKPEDAYERFKTIIREFNTLLEMYAYPEFKQEWQVDPKKGSVAFGSAYYRFGLTIPSLAELWQKKTGKTKDELIQNLWKKENFVKGILGPVYEIYHNLMEGNIPKLKEISKKIQVEVDESVWVQEPRKISKVILGTWMPVHKAVLDMVCTFCPSPLKAQAYRIKSFWDGDPNGEVSKALYSCDEKGPIMIALSKMILLKGKRVIAIGRIFSGTIRAGDRVTTFLPGYVKGMKERHFTTNVQVVAIIMGKSPEAVDAIPAGNVIALAGLKGAMSSATISSLDEVEPFSALSYAVEPVVTVAVEPKKATDLPKLTEGMDLLQLVDPSLKTTINEETGEFLLAGTGELHLEIAMKDLQEMQNIEINQSKPIVVFRESVEGASPTPALAKSPNKHNRLWVICEPLERAVLDEIESGKFSIYGDKGELADTLRQIGWDKNEAKKVWGMAGASKSEVGPNLWVDATKGVQYLNEVREYIMAGFRWTGSEGPLTGSPLYGCKFRLTDVQLHEDTVHRGVAQIMPAARRVIYGSFLTASPILLEPVYKIEVITPETHLGSVYKVITRRRGIILDTVAKEGTPLNTVSGEIPVTESFGISSELRSETSGFAFAQMVFKRWQRVPGNPLQASTLAGQFVQDTRKRKGMKEEVPPASEYIDKL